MNSDKLISKILREMFDYDQKKRIWIRDTFGPKRNAKHRSHYDELKGAVIQRKMIARTIFKSGFLKKPEDFRYIGMILMMGGNKNDFFISEYCLTKAAELKGVKRVLFENFTEMAFTVRGWKRKQIEREYKAWLKKYKA